MENHPFYTNPQGTAPALPYSFAPGSAQNKATHPQNGSFYLQGPPTQVLMVPYPHAPSFAPSQAVGFDSQTAHPYHISRQVFKPSNPGNTTQAFNPFSQAASFRHEVPPATHADIARQNELAEWSRLEEERKKRQEQRAKRRQELRKDSNTNYHSYNEFLEYFPLRRGEEPNPYLLSLLANQPMPTEPTSARGHAIQYAKEHWHNYWVLKDLDFVVEEAKKNREAKLKKLSIVGSTSSLCFSGNIFV